MSDFPNRLKLLRCEKKWTQKQLAEKLNYGYTAISNYESGKNKPSYDDLIKIAKVFNVSTDYLLGISKIRYRALSDEEVCEFKLNLKELIECFSTLNEDEQNYFVLQIKNYIDHVKSKKVYGQKDDNNYIVQWNDHIQ